MRATIEYVKQKFDVYNKLMFAGNLPSIPVRISNASSFMGKCKSKIRRHPDGRESHSDFELCISCYRDLPEKTLDDIIIHEMIHYFIHYNGLVDTSPHGVIFKGIMHSINTAFNRRIEISHKPASDQYESSPAVRRKYHVVAVVRYVSGKYGVKILPRVHETIIKYCRAVETVADINKVDLYMSDDPFFNRYPCSGALKVYVITKEELMQHLENADQLIIKGNQVCLKK